jgi:hypothetical protein
MEQLDTQSIQAERLGSRALTAATVAYGVLGAVALVGFGTLPAASETGPQVVTWFHEMLILCDTVYGHSRLLRHHSL